ncbi:MAG: hypothetical protein U0Q18_18835 [Bryobacteraceae bacterium]
MSGLLVLNTVILLLCGAILAGLFPLRLYAGMLRGLHNTIGITTPSDRQLRWVLIVWLISVVVIFDAMAALLIYVF